MLLSRLWRNSWMHVFIYSMNFFQHALHPTRWSLKETRKKNWGGGSGFSLALNYNFIGTTTPALRRLSRPLHSSILDIYHSPSIDNTVSFQRKMEITVSHQKAVTAHLLLFFPYKSFTTNTIYQFVKYRL